MKKFLLVAIVLGLGATFVGESDAGIFRKRPLFIFAGRRPDPAPTPTPVVPPPVDPSLKPPTTREIQLTRIIEETRKALESLQQEKEATEASKKEAAEASKKEAEKKAEEDTSKGDYTKGIIALMSVLGIGGGVLGARSALADKSSV